MHLVVSVSVLCHGGRLGLRVVRRRRLVVLLWWKVLLLLLLLLLKLVGMVLWMLWVLLLMLEGAWHVSLLLVHGTDGLLRRVRRLVRRNLWQRHWCLMRHRDRRSRRVLRRVLLPVHGR